MFSDRVVNREPEYVMKEKEAIVCGLDVEQLAVGVRRVVVRLKQKYHQFLMLQHIALRFLTDITHRVESWGHVQE